MAAGQAEAAPGVGFASLFQALLLLLSCAAVTTAAASSPSCYDALALGGFHGLALSRGAITGFGEGGAGQTDVPPATAGRTLAVAAGGFFSCALHTAASGSTINSTTVSCWGGGGSSAVAAVPPAVASDGGVRGLAAGGYHVCATLSNRSVVCWGANGAGQASPLPAVVASASSVASLALGAYHSCAVLERSASVACWGRDDFGQVSGVPAALASGGSSSNMPRLTCGGYHCCSWTVSGSSMSCWGAAAAGQTTVPATVAAASNVSAACGGGYFTCAVVNGASMCWGSNTRGETTVPAGARDGSVASIACGWYGACALKLDGSFVCWGGDLGVQAAAASGGQDIIIASADAAGSTSGSVIIASGAVVAGAGGGAVASGTISITTGAAIGNASASSGAIVLATGAASGSGGRRGAISFLAPSVVVEQSLVLAGNLTVGATTLTAADVQALLALAAAGSGSSASPTASSTAAQSAPPSASPTASSAPQGWLVTTLAGNGTKGYADGQGTAATFGLPAFVAVDLSGTVYVADQDNHCIRAVSPNGTVTTIAGNGTQGYADGQGTATSFNQPFGVAVDSSGNVYVADYKNRVRKISPTGAVTTLAGGSSAGGYADGQGAAAAFKGPFGIAVDSAGNVYVADMFNHRIRKISPAGAVTTLAGNGTAAYADGQGTGAAFNWPTGVAVDAGGNVYVADTNNNRIRKINVTGYVATLAGSGAAAFADGQGAAAAFNSPWGVAADTAGFVYVADGSNSAIRKITPAGAVTTVAGNGTAGYADGVGTRAAFNSPFGIAVDSSGNLYVGDFDNLRIRKLSPPTTTTSSSSTPSSSAASTAPAGAAASSSASGTAAAMPAATATPSATASASPTPTRSATGATTPTPTSSATFVLRTWNVTTLAGNGALGNVDGTGTAATFSYSYGIAVDSAGTVYLASGNRIRKISAAGAATSLAGGGAGVYTDGQGTLAAFNAPYGLAVGPSGAVYVADYGDHRIRMVNATGFASTFAGTGAGGYVDGPSASAAFNSPVGVALDAAGTLYVADALNNRIRKISPAGAVTTLAGGSVSGYADGQGSAAAFKTPYGVAVDAVGNVYVADYNNHRIRKVNATGYVTTLAGSGTQGFADGQGIAAKFYYPSGVAVDAAGVVYVADYGNHRIRAVSPSGAVTTVAGSGTAGWADGVGTGAAFNSPWGVAIDTSGTLYVADQTNYRVRKVVPSP